MNSLLSSKVKIFRIFGISVFLHSVFIIYAAWEIYQGFEHHVPGWAMTWLGTLWLSVLLHEFGHCWGARRVGGDAHEILLWPLGGLATVDAPQTPWAQFVTTACGPLVNVILAGAGILTGWLAFHYSPLNLLLGTEWSAGVVAVIVNTNVMLFTFNMIPAFPMDAGRVLHVILWKWLGYQRGLRITVYVSFVCVAGLGVAGIVSGSAITLLIAGFIFQGAYQELRLLQAGYYAEMDEPWRQTFAIREPRPREPGPIARWLSRRADKRERARVQAAEARTLELDQVLKRVSEVGIDGLSPEERAFLDLESARLRSQKRPDA